MTNSLLRVVSGMRTTGKLHLGHYHGVLKNWLKLQHEYECFFFAADWHALTTHYEDPSLIQEHTRSIVIDWLAAGIDPNKAHVFVQSHVPEHAELHLLLSMITPISWLERVPSYKDQQQQLKEKNLATYGFLGYPLLQTADVAIYKANFVPVGEDQVSHIELSREIVRRFNFLYKKDVLVEPKVLLTPAAKLPGLDGRKMSKSYHNFIGLREDPKSVETKIKAMPTDPARVRRTDPGEPEKCPVWGLHKIYSNEDTKEWVVKGCRSAGIGCLDCKKPLIEAIQAEQAPIIERGLQYEQNPALIRDIIAQGSKVARAAAQKTLVEAKEAMGL